MGPGYPRPRSIGSLNYYGNKRKMVYIRFHIKTTIDGNLSFSLPGELS